MGALFVKLLEMSLTGSIVIAVVLLTRLLLKRAPKIYSYLLWSVVLFRLLCPFSVSAGPSVLAPARVDTVSSYLADFRFDEDGNFLNVQLTLNPGTNNERILTQSILLPEQTAASQIREELEKAGKL